MGLELVVTEEVNQRIDKYLPTVVEEMSRSQIQSLIEEKAILVNGKEVKASYLLKKNDIINIEFPEAKPIEIIAEEIPLDIYYEDQDLIVVNKPTGMVVHPAFGNYQGTLVNALMHHCEDLSGINNVLRPGIVHRLDKDTSGLIVACKNDFTHRALSLQFSKKTVTRKYNAIVYGIINHNNGKIDAPIARDPKNRKMMTVIDGGKKAITHFQVLERYKNFSFLELSLETGRTHQIRVHMKYINHPVLGDPLYGPRKVVGKFGQYLHARTLGFIHPRTKEYMEWETELPEYFEERLKIIKNE